jgi:hypothetical protein
MTKGFDTRGAISGNDHPACEEDFGLTTGIVLNGIEEPAATMHEKLFRDYDAQANLLPEISKE